MKTKYQETAFNNLRMNQVAREKGYEADPSFVFKLWGALEQWFVLIIEEKIEQSKKPLLRTYDLYKYSSQLKKILDSQRGKNKVEGGIKTNG